MATEVVKIKFEADTAGLKSASSDVKVLEDQLKKAGVSAEFMDDALDEVGKTLKEANVDAKTFTKALGESANNTKSLRSQLAEARNEAVRMSAQFGAFSKEAREAAKRAAEIKDEIGDLSDTLDALNPDAKLNAFVKLGQGIQGGFQAATGALQVFGVENERITKLAQQFQGVLNLTQGINSVLQLKDVYGQLRLVLGLTTTAQTGLNTSIAAGAVAAAPFIAAIGAALVAVYALTEGLYEEAEASKKAREERELLNKALVDSARSYLDFIGTNEKMIALMREQGVSELEILRLRLKTLDTDRLLLDSALEKAQAADFTKENLELQNELSKKINDSIIDRQILEQQITNEIKKQYLEQLKAAQAQRDIEEAATKGLKAQFESELQARLSEVDKRANLAKLINQVISKTEQERIEEDLNAELDALNAKRKILIEFGKDTEEIDAQIALNKKRFREQDLKDEQELRQQQLESAKNTVETISQLFDSVFAVRQAYNQQEFEDAERLRDRGVLSEEQYAAKVKKIKQKQAEENKKAALFQATLNAASAIINALNVSPANPNSIAAAVALASVLSALNIARIVATPIPKFKQGTLNVGGGNLDADGGMHAIIHKGEAVIPKDRNQAYHPTIAAIYHKRISPAEINSFVDMKLRGKIPTSVDARINRSDLRSLKPVEAVSIKNTGALASQFARELSKYNDLRRI